MPIEFGRFAVTLLLLASGLIGITSLMMSFPEGEAQLIPTRGPIIETVHQTLVRTVRQILQRTVRQILHETVHETFLETVLMPNTHCQSMIPVITNYPIVTLSTTTRSISVTGWSQSSSNMGMVASFLRLGINDPNASSPLLLLGAGAVAGAAVALVSGKLLSRLRGTVSADKLSASDANSSSGTGGVALLEASKDAVSTFSSTVSSSADADKKVQEKMNRDLA